MYRVFITKKAEKELDHIDKIDARKVAEKILKLDFPFAPNLDIPKMGGSNKSYRLRIGKIRVIMEVNDNEKKIYIAKIAYRGGVYRC